MLKFPTAFQGCQHSPSISLNHAYYLYNDHPLYIYCENQQNAIYYFTLYFFKMESSVKLERKQSSNTLTGITYLSCLTSIKYGSATLSCSNTITQSIQRLNLCLHTLIFMIAITLRWILMEEKVSSFHIYVNGNNMKKKMVKSPSLIRLLFLWKAISKIVYIKRVL